MERWLSGWKRRSWKPLSPQGDLEFESLPLRSSSPQYFRVGAAKQLRSMQGEEERCCEAPLKLFNLQERSRAIGEACIQSIFLEA